MNSVLFDSAVVGRRPQDALEFIVNVLQSSTDHSIITQGIDGTIILWNEGARRLYGYSGEEILGRATFEILYLPEEFAAGRPRAIQQEVLRQGKWEGLLTQVRKDREQITVRAVVTPCHDSSGGHIGYVVISNAVTKEAPALQSEDEFGGLLDSVPEAIIILNPDGQIAIVNSQTEELFKYSREQLPGKPIVLLLPEFFTHNVTNEHSSSLANRLELAAVRADGSKFRVEMTVTRTELLGKAMFTACLRDIAERKHLEDEFHRLKQRLLNVVASPSILLSLSVAVDQDQRITWASDSLLDVLGYAPTEALGQEWWLANVHPDDRDDVIAQFQTNLLKLERSTYEYRFRHSDGNYRWTRCELRVIHDEAGQPAEAVGSWTDITERKHLEDQVLQAQKMEAVGRLAGGVAHDFNNLLTVINGCSELVLDQLPVADPLRELMREIVTAGDRAASLTRQLLTFSRKAIIEPKVLDLKALVADMGRMLSRILGEDIQLTVISDPELGVVKADPSQIEQVLLNLVVNARDAMPQGGQLTVEVRNADLDETYTQEHPDSRPGPHVLLAFSDTGCGMDEATLRRIFEPFFTTKGERGTGFGLATVHGIVKQSGGHVIVYSEMGHGTTFKVYLPQVEQQPSLSNSNLGLSPKAKPRGNETVLLVEDEDALRALTRHILERSGYTVLEAREGSEAVRIAEQRRGQIDLLLTDVVMPRMGGREVAARLTGLYPELKVLFLSGYTDDAVVRHGILHAEVAFLQKPFSPASLATKVRDVLDSPASR
ncbi:MAG: Blue-light-activated protein [Planctomycetaceae bacterium]|nr:Blue-light-activated protein [Planctomycetaceae bacterium]